MPPESVLFHRLAAREYRSAREWYRARSAAAAEKFVTAVDQAIGRMGENLDRFPKLFGEYCWVRVGRFPYVLIFRRYPTKGIIIVAVAHTSRRQGYWRSRK
jgi:plasmid stabilization system protein ParE